MKVLVIAAHPDDEVLGCGGTIARLASEGHDVFIAILGEGMTSRYANREDAVAQLGMLHASARRVAEFLRARELFFGDLPDNRFDTIPLLSVVSFIESLISRLSPQVVYTQHGGDLNIDHVITFRATLTATRPMAGTPVRAVYAYPVGSSTEWAFQQFAPSFQPNVYVDISGTLDRKVQAMALYETESRLFPHPRSAEALRAQAAVWGSGCGVMAAEAFELIRQVG